MKTIAKVLESMLTKPATPTWDVDAAMTRTVHVSSASTVPNMGPVGGWAWGG